MLSYLSRIIKQAFFLVNTLSELLTHLHEFSAANQGQSYTFITGFQWRIENVLIHFLRLPITLVTVFSTVSGRADEIYVSTGA